MAKNTEGHVLAHRAARVCMIPLAVLGWAGILATNAASQPTPPPPIQYVVLAPSSQASPRAAAALATTQIEAWAKNGWVPVNVAATYSMQEKDGTTVGADQLWTVDVLLTCRPVARGPTCARLTPP
jgi:hypothetical protein